MANGVVAQIGATEQLLTLATTGGAGSANGVPQLDGAGLIAAALLPATVAYTGASASFTALNTTALGIATGAGNFSSGTFQIFASYYTGSAAQALAWSFQHVVTGTGSTPNSVFQISAPISAPSNIYFRLNGAATATSGANKPAPTVQFQGSYWNGTAAATDTLSLAPTYGVGANPAVTLAVAYSGSTGGFTVSLPALTLAAALPIASGGTGSTTAAAALTALGGVTSTQAAAAAPVQSIFGRTGAVVAAANDYSFSQISGTLAATQLPAFTGDITKAAGSGATTVTGINGTNLAGLGAGLLKQNASGVPALAVAGTDYLTTAPVTSVFGRTGAVVAAANDYTAAQVTGALAASNNLSDVASPTLSRVNINQGAPTALTPGTTVATNAALNNIFTLTPVQSFTLSNPTNLKAGATYMWQITQDGTGSRVLSLGTNFKNPGGVVPVLSTAANAVDLITGYSPDGTLVYLVGVLKGFA